MSKGSLAGLVRGLYPSKVGAGFGIIRLESQSLLEVRFRLLRKAQPLKRNRQIIVSFS